MRCAASLAAVACGRAQGRETAAGDRVPAVEGFVTTSDSVRLYYRLVGSGARTVIIPYALYDGTRLDDLAVSGRRLVLYDPRGRGRSDSVPRTKISLERNLADVETLRRALRADSIALIGWSGGGMEMFAYALRYPGRVTRLVQLAPVAPRWTPYADSLASSRRARTDTAAYAALEARARAGQFASNERALCRAQARITTPASFGDTSRARLVPDVCEWPNEWPSHLGPYFDALLGSMGSFDWRPSLAGVPVPRLVIHGERDNTPLEGNCEWVAGQPAARLMVIRGAGHWPHYERPEETIPAIGAFLDGKWPAGSRSIDSGATSGRCALDGPCC